MNERMPVDGPFRIYVTRLSGGAALDVSHMVTERLLQLARDFEEDPEGVGELLTDIAELDRSATGVDSHAGHERDERLEGLLESIGGGRLHVYGRQVVALAERLMSLVRPRVPQQRGEAA
ncbi:hypothetical protein [Streptomyces sp. NPDC053048]|uniref:hypothetical protein n=1 Tax=Streptomyces sp. NPDC053048 TaxID=3365694 RepID=UPI0037CFCDF4